LADTPNIFDFATGELSQDAFLAWISKWADSNFATIDPALNTVARSVLVEFCDNKISAADIKTVTVYLQYKKTDVLIDIELKTDGVSNQLILIEDKTGTGQHSGQLQRYKEAIVEELQADGKFKDREPHYIYFKTHDHLTYDLSGFRSVNRNEFLKILESPVAKTINNQIFIDYVSRLRRMENDSQAYSERLVEKWKYPQWSGFLMALCKRLGRDANFGFVPNPSGGFIAAWFGNIKIDGMEDSGSNLYFQIEAFPKPFVLTLRISTPSKESTTELKNRILPGLKAKLELANLATSSKNLRSGKSIRLLTFDDVNICETDNKVGELANRINEIFTIVSE